MRRLRPLLATMVLLVALAAAAPPAGARRPAPRHGLYEVGVGVRSINPDRPDGTWDGSPIYLGGYGIGGGTPWLQGRQARGIVGDGLHVRAFVVGDGDHTVAIADAELQGWFAATRDGRLGIIDVRRRVQELTGGAIRAQDVVVQSDHSHSGPDLMGPWGGAPRGYRQHVVDQTVGAILDAYAARRGAPAGCSTGPPTRATC